ncbi:transcription factor MYB90, putative [Entamoeba dispar SAW760]|uniref:Transcription factor MYB90, putative n=1 Tax=Entamoeba dispar (strain ATCC PRA-260 / SAW760) TaxID=370354 RepID=B0E6Z9_ENTDS|nr:transcription factor MYB90, putative [Entamoeba dispar SAW760]EDR29740.1 transcription factor MYB90, putative [Entamoeba dispar SAW760]|eukprot:EDR29740.1 transcription factor MYB90, putative [Entamoeba dispar SAW760]
MTMDDISSSDSCFQERRKKSVIPWTSNDDEKLLNAIKKYGKENWKSVSDCLPNKTRKQCRERYYNCLSDDIAKKPWSKEEDQMLIDLQKILGNKWTEMSKSFQGRTPNSLKNRFFSHLHPEYRKKLRENKINRTPDDKSEKNETKPPKSPSQKSAFIRVKSSKYEII